MSSEKISKKLLRFSHEIKHVLQKKKINIKKFSDKKNINDKIKNMNDIYGRKNIKLKVINIDSTFPEEIYKNKKKYKNLINNFT